MRDVAGEALLGMALLAIGYALPPDLPKLVVAGVGVVLLILAFITFVFSERGKAPKMTDGKKSKATAKTTGDGSHAFAITGGKPTINIGPSEKDRRSAIVERLHHQYWNEYALMNLNGGISPRQFAHAEPAPMAWLNARLAEMDEHWTAEPYYRFARRQATDT